MSKRLDEIEERAAAATPGPWGKEHRDSDWQWCDDPVDRVTISVDERGFTTSQVGPMRAPDAVFIASAPTDIAYLLRVARAAEQLLSSFDPRGDQSSLKISDSVAKDAAVLHVALEGREP